MTEVVNFHPVESGAGSDTPPGVLQVGEVPALFAAGDHPRIVLIAGQGDQQPYGGGRKRNCSPASLRRALSLSFIPSIAETLEFFITTGYPFRHA